MGSTGGAGRWFLSCAACRSHSGTRRPGRGGFFGSYYSRMYSCARLLDNTIIIIIIIICEHFSWVAVATIVAVAVKDTMYGRL